MPNYGIRVALPKDYNDIYEMKKRAFKRYIIENWGSWDESVQRKYFDNFVDKYKGNIYIIRVNKVDVGFFAGVVQGSGYYHIGTIVIKPEYQGYGIGTSVLRDIILQNRDRNIEVKYFKSNPVGELYRRLGFVPYGETEYHYHVVKWSQK